MSIVILISGALWLIFHYFIIVQGQFGESRHPLETWWLRLHGAAAMVFHIVLGTLLPIHIRRGWQLRRNFQSGVAVLLIVAALVITGYGLYYISSEELRPWVSVFHWAIGLTGTAALILHILLGKRKAAYLHLAQPKQLQRQSRNVDRTKRTGI